MKGGAAPCLAYLSAVLRRDNYRGPISYKSVYRPDGGTFEDGFRTRVPACKALFGDGS